MKWHYFIYYGWVIFYCIFYDIRTLDSGLRDVTDRPVCMNILSWWGVNHDSPEETYLMVWASWKNSSSDMERSLITLTEHHSAPSTCPEGCSKRATSQLLPHGNLFALQTPGSWYGNMGACQDGSRRLWGQHLHRRLPLQWECITGKMEHSTTV